MPKREQKFYSMPITLVIKKFSPSICNADPKSSAVLVISKHLQSS